MKVLIVASHNCGKYSPLYRNKQSLRKKKNTQIDYFPVEGKGFRGIGEIEKKTIEKK